MSYVKFKELSMSNFMPFGQEPVKVNLDSNTTRLILGCNDDVGDPGESKNGAGKSTIMQAISYTLFGQGIKKKLKEDEFVNFINGKKMVVKLSFEKDGQLYTIIRGRKPNKLEFYKGDEAGESLTLDSLANTNKAISKVIGWTYEVFMTAFYLSPKKESFMAKSGPEQRAIIEEILSLDVLSTRAASLKVIREEVEIDAKLLRRDLENATHVNIRVDENVSRIQNKRIEFINNQQEKTSKIIDAIQNLASTDLHSLKEQFLTMSILEEETKSLRDISDQLSTKRSKLNVDIISKESDVAAVKKELKDYMNAKEQSSIFDVNEERRIESVEAQLKEYPDLITLESYINAFMDRQKVKSDIQVVDSKINLLDNKITNHENRKSRIESQLISLKAGICEMCKQSHVDKDEELELENNLNEEVCSIDCLSKDLSVLKTEKSTLEEKLSEYNVTLEGIALSEIKDAKTEVQKLTLELAKNNENPWVSIVTTFEEAGVSAEAIEEIIDSAAKDIEKMSIERTNAVDEIQTMKEKLTETEQEVLRIKTELKGKGFTSIEQVDGIKDKIKELETQKEAIINEVNPYIEEEKQAILGKVDSVAVEESLKAIETKITHIGYLIKLLTDSKSFVRKRMVDQYIPFVNKRINEYTEMLGLPHTAEINADLSVNIQYRDKELSYYNLSEGETLRLDVATSSAMRDLLGLLGKNNNILLIDELFDSGGDASLINRAFKFVQNKAENVMLISHREEFKDVIDNHIIVTKKNDFSDIEEIIRQ